MIEITLTVAWDGGLGGLVLKSHVANFWSDENVIYLD